MDYFSAQNTSHLSELSALEYPLYLSAYCTQTPICVLYLMLFLDYIVGYRNTGLCNFVIDNSKAHDFLKSQKVFEVNADTPVEYFILRSKKKSTKNAWYNYTTTCSFNDPATPEGRLRIWWATNLAIAVSQGKI